MTRVMQAMRSPAVYERIESADGHTVGAVCEAASAAAPQPVPVCFLSPAMGVEPSFYRGVAAALAEAGMHAMVPGLRGSRSSSVPVERGSDFGYHDVLERDWPAAIAFARERFGDGPLVLVGHSLGGQLHCLHQARAAPALQGAALVLLAVASAHHRGFPLLTKLPLWLSTQTAAVIAGALGYFPGHRLGFGGRQPRRLIQDWARDARLGRYILGPDRIDYTRALAQLRAPVLAMSFDRDHYAPAAVMDALCERLSGADIDRVHLTAAALGAPSIDHFRWVVAAETVARHIATWLAGRGLLVTALAEGR